MKIGGEERWKTVSRFVARPTRWRKLAAESLGYGRLAGAVEAFYPANTITGEGRAIVWWSVIESKPPCGGCYGKEEEIWTL